ncbi:MAG: glycosyl hydrolase [Saccharofermentanales bacterium]
MIYTTITIIVAGAVFMAFYLLMPVLTKDASGNNSYLSVITSSDRSAVINSSDSGDLSGTGSLTGSSAENASSGSKAGNSDVPGVSQIVSNAVSESYIPVPTTSAQALKLIGQRDAKFAKPPSEYRVIELYTGKRLDIADMTNKNMGGPIAGVNWGPDYLNNELSWIALNQDLIKSKNAGMTNMIWDEKGYPSGAAGGLAVAGKPEYEARGVYKVVLKGEGTGSKELGLPSGAEKFVSAVLYPVINNVVQFDKGKVASFTDAKAVTTGMSGKWELWAAAEKILFEGTHAYLMRTSFNSTGRYPNLMDRDAVKSFIDITYGKYKEKVNDFNKNIYAFVAGEPSLQAIFASGDSPKSPDGIACFPWDKNIPARFQSKYGYDLKTVLPMLLGGDGEINKRVRYQYYTIVGDLMTENFSRQITQWCESNGVKSSAWFLSEENISQHVTLFGNFLQALGEYSIPGADSAILSHEKYSQQNLTGLKYASSAARLKGKYKVFVFMDPLLGGYGNDSVVSSDVLIRNMNMMFHFGASSVGTYGHYDNAEPADYARYNNYAGRCGVMLQGAVDKSQTALYYPIETFQGRFIPTDLNLHSIPSLYSDIESTQHELSKLFTNQSIDFNHIDAASIIKATIRNKSLIIGKNEYKVVIMPSVELIELNVIEKLNLFEAAGGTVIYYKTRPSIAGKANQTTALKNAVSNKMITTQIAPLLYLIRDAIEDKVTIEASTMMLFSQYTKDTRHLVFLINTDANAGTVTISIKNAKTARILNPENGQITSVKLPYKMTVGGFRSVFVEVTG